VATHQVAIAISKAVGASRSGSATTECKEIKEAGSENARA